MCVNVPGGILAGLVSDYTGGRASTCCVMLIVAAPMVSASVIGFGENHSNLHNMLVIDSGIDCILRSLTTACSKSRSLLKDSN